MLNNKGLNHRMQVKHCPTTPLPTWEEITTWPAPSSPLSLAFLFGDYSLKVTLIPHYPPILLWTERNYK